MCPNRYPDADRDALVEVDLVVPAATSLALVGETGSGKTTLASLVPRLRDPSVGRVLVDGVDLRDLSFEDLSRIVGVVSQETYLLHASIRENLLYAKPDAADVDLWRALEAAQIADLVPTLAGEATRCVEVWSPTEGTDLPLRSGVPAGV